MGATPGRYRGRGSVPSVTEPVLDAFERALASVDPTVGDELRELARDSAFVDPRVVSHLM